MSALIQNIILDGVINETPRSSSVSAVDGVFDEASDRSSVTLDHTDDPVCIVGIACRLPGGIRSSSELWDFLAQKRSAQGKVPPGRFNIKGFYHPDGSRTGVMDADGGYFVEEDVRQFENTFFDINNLEATHMDPQQRKLLEVVYECFENAGVSMDEVSGSNTGVYVGNFTVDYQTMQARDPDYLHRYTATGSGTAIMANRISHVFNLQGPSFVLDTGCSSSLYCLHNAVNAIKSGDCDAAIVAGANLITSPEQQLGTMKAGVLSPNSTCRTFDASANGYGRADAINSLLVKRLSRAIRDGDKIWAVIRGTAINSNGRTPGITQPSPAAQEAVIRKAYCNADLDFADTDYVECHGTGTAIGDPMEVDALGSCFAQRTGAPLLIGSVKTNLGHSEAASGLTSILKVVAAFERGLIPPTHGVKTLNPRLRLDSLNMKVVTDIESWPRELRRASINSFGYGGANSHAIIESFDSYLNYSQPEATKFDDARNDQLLIFPVSAFSKASLEASVERIGQSVLSYDRQTLRRAAYTLAKRRSQFKSRHFLLAKTTAGGATDIIPSEVVNSQSALPFAFVFTGQGAQYPQMARDLLQTDERFLASIRQLDAVLKDLPQDIAPNWTLEQTILDPPETSQINEVTRSQPICTAIQMALIDMLYSWGIKPTSVVGHSSGEIAATYAAGLLTARQAIISAYLRGYAVSKLQRHGAMMAARIDADSALSLINEKGLTGKVCIACFNAPESVTFSGEEEGIDELKTLLQEKKKLATKLMTGGKAYHSHMMKDIGQLYEDLLMPYFENDNAARPSTAKIFSSAGYSIEEMNALDTRTNMAKYWRANLEQPVQFNAALSQLSKGGQLHLIEIGPHSALKGPVQQIRAALKLSPSNLLYSPTFVRKQNSSVCIKRLAGELFVHGHSLNWDQVNNLRMGDQSLIASLPPYLWNYSGEALWFEPRPSAELRNRKYIRHELLGSHQVAGNGIDHAWRNVLRLNEVPWLADHKLEASIVFPAAGYLCAVIEALTQIQDTKDALAEDRSLDLPLFGFKNVSIAKALVVDEDVSNEIELHTTMSLRKISNTSSSNEWYDFSISSWSSGQTAVHCTGSVRLVKSSTFTRTAKVQNTDNYETWSTAPWYKKFDEKGLCFGPHFQSLKTISTDAQRTRPETFSTVQIRPDFALHVGTYYAMHPITIDACLQAAIMGIPAGNINTMRAFVPVFISECHIQAVSSSRPSNEATIHTRSWKTGVASEKIDCTLEDEDGIPLIDFKNVRLAHYTGKEMQHLATTSIDVYDQRQPCLRVTWKPDVTMLYPGVESSLSSIVERFAQDKAAELGNDDTLSVTGLLLDLAAHKNPRLQILELGSWCMDKADRIRAILGEGTAFPRFLSWTTAVIDEDGRFSLPEGAFDVILVPDNYWKIVDELRLLYKLSPSSLIITQKQDLAVSSLTSSGLPVLELNTDILFAVSTSKVFVSQEYVIVVNEPSALLTELTNALSTYLKNTFASASVTTISLADLGEGQLSETATCISFVETEHSFLTSMDQHEMDLFRRITNSATSLLWVTGASILGCSDANLTLSSGLSRAIMMEQPSLRFSVLDIGRVSLIGPHELPLICENIGRVLESAQDMDDKEFILSNGVLNISRFTPDFQLNQLFRQRLEPNEPIEKVTLADAKHSKLTIGRVGVTDTIHFQQLNDLATDLPADHVEVSVKAVSLNAKDIYAMGGRVETTLGTLALEFGGIVTQVGSAVRNLLPGDRVAVWAPNNFSTTERVPAWAVHRLLVDEDFKVVPALLTTYCTALYALEDRARLRAGESILVHAGSGALGIAAISLAQRIGAVVYTTVSTPEKKQFLVEELGLPASRIFNSRDSSFVDDLQKATNGKGIDVILNSLTGDLLHSTWECLANFGRFVEVGKRELVDAGKLSMEIFSRNATFTAFDLTELYYHDSQFYRETLERHMREVLRLYRSGQIKAPPISTFDISEVSQAYRYFSSKDRVGKVVISLENPNSLISLAPAKYLTTLDPRKVYLLIGCLGGLGRSLSRWMVSRGAKHFVFLGRSGADKPSAKDLVSRIERSGGHVTVVRGDVSRVADVEAAISACLATGLPIGGVVQAAMGLHEALFYQMSSNAWHTGIQPKWAGTWHLHNTLDGHDSALDFFLMTSSVSGSVGTATESNYCSANGFLDAFAQWRREQGKPGVSVGLGMISEVGYLHENPEIEALLLRKGIQPLSEEEFLQIIDLSLGGPGGDLDRSSGIDPKKAHILTGLEPFGFRKLVAQGFDVSGVSTQDSRSSMLAASLEASQNMTNTKQGAGSDKRQITAAPWYQTASSNIQKMLSGDADAETMLDAILQVIRKRFCNLLLMKPEQVDDKKPLAQFGVDSMIAAEFRAWFWSTFKADVPFLDLLSPVKSLADVAECVQTKLFVAS